MSSVSGTAASLATQTVTPFEVQTDGEAVDYAGLVAKFGVSLLTPALLARLANVLGPDRPLHPYLTRRIFFAHRDFESILECLEQNRPFYLYTGRGPSSDALHLGHMSPFLFTKWLQDVFDVPVVIQLTDDEKYLLAGTHRKTADGSDERVLLSSYQRYARENLLDIMSVGFDPAKTFVFTNTDFIGEMYPMVLRIQKRLRLSETKSTFGFKDSANIGMCAFPAKQLAPAFAETFHRLFAGHLARRFPGSSIQDMRCIVPCGIDQDPYFRLARDVAQRLGLPKPALLHGRFLPSLLGVSGKMSASKPDTSVFLTDERAALQQKIGRCTSGGQETRAEHERRGADLNADVPFHYLCFFMDLPVAGPLPEQSDAAALPSLAEIWRNYGSADSRGARPELPGAPPLPGAQEQAVPMPGGIDSVMPDPATAADGDTRKYLITAKTKKHLRTCLLRVLARLRAARANVTFADTATVTCVRELVWDQSPSSPTSPCTDSSQRCAPPQDPHFRDPRACDP